MVQFQTNLSILLPLCIFKKIANIENSVYIKMCKKCFVSVKWIWALNLENYKQNFFIYKKVWCPLERLAGSRIILLSKIALSSTRGPSQPNATGSWKTPRAPRVEHSGGELLALLSSCATRLLSELLLCAPWQLAARCTWGSPSLWNCSAGALSRQLAGGSWGCWHVVRSLLILHIPHPFLQLHLRSSQATVCNRDRVER